MDLLLRFVIGGMVVSLFALLGDVFKPKSFAGLFAAAPTVALASIALTQRKHGSAYVALETRSMIAGSAAFFLYAVACSFVLMRGKWKALPVSAALLPVWVISAAAIWAMWLKGGAQ